MKILLQITLLFITLAWGADAAAQMTVGYPADANNKTMQPWDTNVRIYKDPRIDLLVEKHKNIQRGLIRAGRGYRIQIYAGTDRAKAIQRKVDFMRRYPGIKTYMTYIQPQYRVKVGDFVTREDAIELYREAIAIYGAAMIVPDAITVNTIGDD